MAWGDRVSLVGNSFGGFLATHFAIQLPERVTKLVLIGPGVDVPRHAGLLRQDVRAEGRVPDAAVAAGRDRVMRACEEWMYAGLPRDPPWSELFDARLLHGGTVNQVFPRVFTRTSSPGSRRRCC